MSIYKTAIITGSKFNEGCANFTVVGNPTINMNGILSEITGSDYIKINIGNLKSNSVLTGSMRVTLPSSFSQSEEFVVINPANFGGSFYTRFRIIQGTSNWVFQLYTYDGTSTGNTSTSSIASFLGKDINISFTISNALRSISLTDGTTTLTGSNTTALSWNNLDNVIMNVGRYSNTVYFNGSIDLRNLAIKVNNELAYVPATNLFTTSSYQTTANNFYEI